MNNEIENLKRKLKHTQEELSYLKHKCLGYEKRDKLNQIVETDNSSKAEYFDPVYYESNYPDVRASGMDPLDHYNRFGKLLGRKPNDSAD